MYTDVQLLSVVHSVQIWCVDFVTFANYILVKFHRKSMIISGIPVENYVCRYGIIETV